ncbi:DUF3795 domain-containing protein [Promethearchaeum syntrophicum]|uniref:DUF3795 domain-containing protein n=1 Tax=Promethearchaeum syntrophicum TaxID=2594042 RepID=A0A5B9D5M6_9ARCH|nr:DUF3795 domain-containing protein [Candidatus Prometheoarchaeum syntrophicum]QEE14419.1 hypothetical protein DSAG12_00232 [Candidatus Prometheoarchaeum syntrophicum]
MQQYSKCGMDCSLCPWSKSVRQTMNNEGFQEFRTRCKSVLGYSPSESFSNCVGCQTPNEEIPPKSYLPTPNCKVRKCVQFSEIENCAYCSNFPCPTIDYIAGLWTREKLEKQRKTKISDLDYQQIVEPFEGLRHLNEIRQDIAPSDYKKPKLFPSLDYKIVPFPAHFTRYKEKMNDMMKLYEQLCRLYSNSDNTYAGQQSYKEFRRFTYNFFWIMGKFGIFELKEKKIVIDQVTFMREKKKKNLTRRNHFFKMLKSFGIRIEELNFTKKTGNLKMSFDLSIGGSNVLHGLQIYINELDKNFGKNATRHLSKADFLLFSEPK